jgi:hypothetical protein
MCRLACSNTAGTGPFSEPSAVATAAVPPTAPSPPIILPPKKKTTPNELELTWQPPQYLGGAKVTAFKLEQAPFDPNNALSSAVAAAAVWNTAYEGPAPASYSVKQLQPGSYYQYRISCVNAAGWSPLSSVSVGLTKPDLPGKIPTFVTTKLLPTTIGLAWGQPADNGVRGSSLSSSQHP